MRGMRGLIRSLEHLRLVCIVCRRLKSPWMLLRKKGLCAHLGSYRASVIIHRRNVEAELRMNGQVLPQVLQGIRQILSTDSWPKDKTHRV